MDVFVCDVAAIPADAVDCKLDLGPPDGSFPLGLGDGLRKSLGGGRKTGRKAVRTTRTEPSDDLDDPTGT